MQLFVSQENMLTVDELKIFVDLDIYIYIYIFRSCVRSELVLSLWTRDYGGVHEAIWDILLLPPHS